LGGFGIVGSGVRGEAAIILGGFGIVGSGVSGEVEAKAGAATRTTAKRAKRTFCKGKVIDLLLLLVKLCTEMVP
jgi:hypothetical protein